MGSEGIDPVGFRAAQRDRWGAVAVGWNEWREFNDRADRHISERLVEPADVRAGNRELDVAAGHGEPALTRARPRKRPGTRSPRPPRISAAVRDRCDSRTAVLLAPEIA